MKNLIIIIFLFIYSYGHSVVIKTQKDFDDFCNKAVQNKTYTLEFNAESICQTDSILFLDADCSRSSKFKVKYLILNNISSSNLNEFLLKNIELSSIEYFEIYHTQIKDIDNVISKMVNLNKAVIVNTNITKLSVIENLENLVEIEFGGCKFLTNGICNFENLINLERFILADVPLKEIDNSIGRCNNIDFLSITQTSIKEIPISISNLEKLRYFYLQDNYANELKIDFSGFNNLEALILSHLNYETLDRVFKELGENNQALKEIYLYDCYIQKLPESIYKLKSFRRLESDFYSITPSNLKEIVKKLDKNAVNNNIIIELHTDSKHKKVIYSIKRENLKLNYRSFHYYDTGVRNPCR